jgi:hypothetical protein
MSLRERRWVGLAAALPACALALLHGACTSLTIEPRNAHEGVVVGYAWSFNFLTITVPLSPRSRALDLVGGARLEDVRNAEIEEWPDLIWPISWLNGLIGFCGAEVRAEYGLPPPVEASSVKEPISGAESAPSGEPPPPAPGAEAPVSGEVRGVTVGP